MRYVLALVLCLVASCATSPTRTSDASHRQPNILFILTDDHRYDCFGFMGHPWLETPNMDRLAREGAWLKNAFVTTSLCSPSRASILTGLYAHAHKVIDNYTPVSKDLVFFPQLLQKAGYETALIGKWHMGGDIDDPQRGFDHWVSFKGQGSYWADGHGTTRIVPQTSSDGFNVDGHRVPQRGYITDELTDYAIDWLKQRRGTSGGGKPWFLYLSHKAVHSDFVPADRHRGKYAGKKMPPIVTPAPLDGPMWTANQRNSRHGVDYAYNLPPGSFDLEAYYQRYCETLLAVDESIGRIMDLLRQRGELQNTLIVYMGDNGFQFGEHGLIDKRTAYEPSMRVPLLAWCPTLIKPGTVIEHTVANIDIAPTLLDAAGLTLPGAHGQSALPLLTGRERDTPGGELLYEYFWEHNYPQTPTMHALRDQAFKYIRYHGIWDTDELYDLTADPTESHNLIHDPAHQQRIKQMNARLFQRLAQTGGDAMVLSPDRGETFPWRSPTGSKPADFPRWFYK